MTSVLQVPSYKGTLAKLPRDRRGAFVAHLRRIIWEAMEVPSRPSRKRIPDPPSPAQLDLAAWACAACGGECCSKGGTHAYLDDDTIHRVARERPRLSRRELAELYTACLPLESFAGSCVFHGAEGCTLPRSLRSDLCNSFYCTPLKRFFRDEPEAVVGDIRIEAVTERTAPKGTDTR